MQHHGIYEAVFEYDEERDHDAHKDAHKAKLTLTECVVALIISYVQFAPLAQKTLSGSGMQTLPASPP